MKLLVEDLKIAKRDIANPKPGCRPYGGDGVRADQKPQQMMMDELSQGQEADVAAISSVHGRDMMMAGPFTGGDRLACLCPTMAAILITSSPRVNSTAPRRANTRSLPRASKLSPPKSLKGKSSDWRLHGRGEFRAATVRVFLCTIAFCDGASCRY